MPPNSSDVESTVGALPGLSIDNLYTRYGAELRDLTERLRHRYHAMQLAGDGTTFADVEGEILYMLVRESRPHLVFEVSPDAGWSTNYLLAALTANKAGELHSFELARNVRGVSIERLIRGNQDSAWDVSRLTVHLGDARETVGRVAGEIQFLFLDSCHDEDFARWYVDTLFPRVRGTVMIHDVAFIDRLEPSGEAAFLWQWLARQRVALRLAADVEATIDRRLRFGFAERTSLRSNAAFFVLPGPADGRLPELHPYPAEMIGRARSLLRSTGSSRAAIDLLHDAIAALHGRAADQMRHRDYFAAAAAFRAAEDQNESRRCLRRALAAAIDTDFRLQRKAFGELIDGALDERMWSAAVRTAAVAVMLGHHRLILRPLRWLQNRVRGRLT
jgi:predicted O-methyltransferase YrrM